MIVIDAAAVVDALTMPDGTADLRSALAQADLHAPHLLDHEVVAALRGLHRGGKISPSRAVDALSDFDDLPIQRWPAGAGLRLRAFSLRESMSAYDAAYVALAEALSATLLTRDVRLARAAGRLVTVDVR